MFLKNSGVDHLSGVKFSVNHRGRYHKKDVGNFSFHKKNSKEDFLVLLKVSGSKKFYTKGVS